MPPAILRATTRNVIVLGLVAAAALGARYLVFAPMVHAESGFAPFELQPQLNREALIIQLHAATAGPAVAAYLRYVTADIAVTLATACFVAMLWAWLFARVTNRVFATFARGGILLVPAVAAAMELTEHVAVLRLIFDRQGVADRVALVSGLHSAKLVVLRARDVLTVGIVLTALFETVIRKRRRS